MPPRNKDRAARFARLANGVRKGGRVIVSRLLPQTLDRYLRGFTGHVARPSRSIVDLWNPEFFAAHQGERELNRPTGTVRENKRVEGDRLFVDLEYPSGNREQFEWQLFSPAQMSDFARSVGLELVVSCTDFDAKVPPSAEKPRIQFVLNKQ
jgi:hypothetical protein